MSSKKENIITLAIATSLLHAEGQQQGGKYKREIENLWAIVDVESMLIGNSFTRAIAKHVKKNVEILKTLDDKQAERRTMILDMLAKVISGFSTQSAYKYKVYVEEVEKITNKFIHWWTDAFNCDISEAEEAVDEMIGNLK